MGKGRREEGECGGEGREKREERGGKRREEGEGKESAGGRKRKEGGEGRERGENIALPIKFAPVIKLQKVCDSPT